MEDRRPKLEGRSWKFEKDNAKLRKSYDISLNKKQWHYLQCGTI